LVSHQAVHPHLTTKLRPLLVCDALQNVIRIIVGYSQALKTPQHQRFQLSLVNR